MTRSVAHETLWEFFKLYFEDETVIFGGQQRTAKPTLPIVVINTKENNRTRNPNYEVNGLTYETFYQIEEVVDVELFTKGKGIVENGKTVAYSNSAVEEILGFADFINKKEAVEWCDNKNVSFICDGKLSEDSGTLDKSGYQYKAKISLKFYYYEKAVGYKNTTGSILGGTE